MRLTARILVCLGICAWLVANTLRWQHAMENYEAKFTPALHLPGADKPIFLGADCYDWLIYAQRMAATGEWRIRHTNIDNTPYGREMNWSQSIAWLEVLAGKIRCIATGESMGDAIPRAAIWVNPAILAAVLCLLFCLLEMRTGFAPAALAVVWMLSLADVASAYHSHRPDHQSLHLAFSLMGWLLLLCGGAGWVSPEAGARRKFRWLADTAPPPGREARRWFLASGVACGLALWIGATVELFNLAPLLGGAWVAAFLFRDKSAATDERFVPGLYRIWGRSLAAVSLAMYAVEYFPNHLSWRLETNHPLYALAAFAGAELLARLVEIRDGKQLLRARDWLWLGVLAGSMMALPAVLYFGGVAVHAMRDPQVLRMHDFIHESQSFAKFYDAPLLPALWRMYLILPLFVPLALACVFLAKLRPVERWVLWIAAVTSLAMLVLACTQQRWTGSYVQSGVLLMALALPILLRLPAPRLRMPVAATAGVLLVAVASWLFVQQGMRLNDLASGIGVDKQLAKIVLIKRFAVQMAAHLGNGEARLMVEPGLAPPLAYFGGLASTASLYWENGDGMHAATAFFDATDDAKARSIATERGITHVVLPLNGEVAVFFHTVRTGSREAPDPAGLASRLTHGGPLPAWMSRDHAFDEMGRCVFRSWQLEYALGVWRVAPAGSP